MEPKLETYWDDGLHAALNIFNSGPQFEVEYLNLFTHDEGGSYNFDGIDFILGWGGFNSPADKLLSSLKFKSDGSCFIPKGLCIGGNAFPVRQDDTYDVLFYETTWFAPQVKWHKNAVRAFGINSEVFFEYREEDFSPRTLRENYPLYNFVSAGSLSNWKRHEKLCHRGGYRLCVGQIQEDNLAESMEIATHLLKNGVAVSDMVNPWELATIFNLTETVYVPANILGGGERVLWEARACGAHVEIEKDNPKLKSLLDEEVLDEYHYYQALKKGIESCLK